MEEWRVDFRALATALSTRQGSNKQKAAIEKTHREASAA